MRLTYLLLVGIGIALVAGAPTGSTHLIHNHCGHSGIAYDIWADEYIDQFEADDPETWQSGIACIHNGDVSTQSD